MRITDSYLQLVMDILRESKPEKEAHPKELELWHNIAEQFANKFDAISPSFSKEIFLRSCNHDKIAEAEDKCRRMIANAILKANAGTLKIKSIITEWSNPASQLAQGTCNPDFDEYINIVTVEDENDSIRKFIVTFIKNTPVYLRHDLVKLGV